MGTADLQRTGVQEAAAGADAAGRSALTPPRAIIETKPFDASRAGVLGRELGIGPVLAAVLAARGFEDAEAARGWLEPSASLEPGALGEVEAARLLAAALAADRTIAIHGDYDCDGVCSTAALTLGLRALGGAVVPRVPERSDGYGLSIDAIDDLAATGASILIAVDCGITALEEVAHARELGLEVVVVDHHRPAASGRLPDATIVHPQVPDPGGLPMCATAVAVALVRATARELGRTLPDLGLDELQALATVTDVMPLEGVNRGIVREGLARLGSTRRRGLAALLDSAGVDRSSLTARHLGFTVGPRINAAGRVRAASAALELLLTDDAVRASALAEDLEAANAERRSIQKQTMIAAEMQASSLPDAAGWVLAGDGWHPGVVGIVAGSLAGRYHRPTVVLAVEGDLAVGSARSVPGFNVAEALDQCADLLERHGGHAAAAGLTVRREAIDSLATRFAEVVERTLPESARQPRVVADATVAPGELTMALAEDLARLEPTGEGNRPPLLALSGVRCERPRRMGDGRHARFALTAGNSSSNAVAFDSRERISVGWGEPADVVGTLSVNRWNGVEEPRFTVERAVAAGDAWIDVLGTERSWLERVDGLRGWVGPEDVPSGVRRSLERSVRPILGSLAAVARQDRPAVIVADVERRLSGLEQAGLGLDLVSWLDVALWPELIEAHETLVMLDPPPSASLLDLALSSGTGIALQAWGEPEVRFSLKVHEHSRDIEHRIRPFYAELRESVGQGPQTVLAALRGQGRRSRPPLQVASMLDVLEEIGAVEVDLGTPSIELLEPTGTLDSSQLYGAIGQDLEEGRVFLGRLISG